MRIRSRSTPGLLALGVTALLVALSGVAWRQSRAREALADLERIRGERMLLASELAEADRRLQYLESRGRVVPEARSRLDMRAPAGDEIVLLRRGTP